MWNKLLLKKQINRVGSNINETIKKQLQKAINDFPSLQPTLSQKKKIDYGFHYLKYAVLLSQPWKTIWSNKVDAGPSNSHSMEKSFNL